MTTRPLAGALTVLCTPFFDDGRLDETSMARLASFCVERGARGVVCFGLAGEAYKLTDAERATALRSVVAAVAGAVPVVAGAEHGGTEAAVARATAAEAAGADALMLYPPTFVKPDAAGVVDYYAAVAAAVDVPIVIQDAPAWTGVSLPVDMLVTLMRSSPRLAYVKVEAPPAAPKIDALRGAGLAVIGGYGSMHLAEELAHDVCGFMPGCALPGLYADLWTHHEAGRSADVWTLFTQALPLLAWQMSSLDVFVAVQKELLVRQGVIESNRLRRPGAQLSVSQVSWLDTVLERTRLDRYLDAATVAPGRAR